MTVQKPPTFFLYGRPPAVEKTVTPDTITLKGDAAKLDEAVDTVFAAALLQGPEADPYHLGRLAEIDEWGMELTLSSSEELKGETRPKF